jgi:RimJ/RimL family protein N-acetyltransferase
VATPPKPASLAYAFDVMGEAEVFSVILPDNHRSQAVARRLGLTVIEARVLSSYPAEPHGIWRVERRQWHESPMSKGRDGSGPLL